MLHRRALVASELAHELRNVARALCGSAVSTAEDWGESHRAHTRSLAERILLLCDSQPPTASDPAAPRPRGRPRKRPPLSG